MAYRVAGRGRREELLEIVRTKGESSALKSLSQY